MFIQITIFYNKTKTTDEITLSNTILNVILLTSNKITLAVKSIDMLRQF